jgi:hypothetical protein
VIATSADALVVRAGRQPWGEAHTREVTLCGQMLGKKSYTYLGGLVSAAAVVARDMGVICVAQASAAKSLGSDGDALAATIKAASARYDDCG